MQFTTLSDESLESDLQVLVDRETLTTIEILHHLIEVERRELHLRAGYSSIWKYAVEGLKYSEPAAHRRISAARCVVEYPQLESYLKERRLSLTTLSLVAKLLSPENIDRVMEKVLDRTRVEVEDFLSVCRPKTRIVEKVTPVTVVQPPKPTTSTTLQLPVSSGSPVAVLRPEPPASQVYKVQCALSDEGYRKLKEVQSLLSHTTTSIGEVVERLCEDFLHSTRAKRPRSWQAIFDPRRMDAERARASRRVQRRAPTRPVKRVRTFSEDSRHIPRTLEKAVWERDGGCCSYIAPDGTRCGSKHQIQVDHIHPFALGGKTELTNLRLLCAVHNGFVAREVFGHQTIKEIVGRRREKVAG